MATICNDPVFGEMTYDYGWCKTEGMPVFGREWPIEIIAKSFKERPITDEQREAYGIVRRILTENASECAALLEKYAADNGCGGEAPEQVYTPRFLQISKLGQAVLLLDCRWDEHGVALSLTPALTVGSQDEFL